VRYSTLVTLLLFTASVQAQVTSDNILNANREPQNWLTYSGGYSSQRYSLLDKINRDNVKDLQLKWVYRPSALASAGPEGGPRQDGGDAPGSEWDHVYRAYSVDGRQYVAVAAKGALFAFALPE
jgi:hypothetical protein